MVQVHGGIDHFLGVNSICSKLLSDFQCLWSPMNFSSGAQIVGIAWVYTYWWISSIHLHLVRHNFEVCGRSLMTQTWRYSWKAQFFGTAEILIKLLMKWLFWAQIVCNRRISVWCFRNINTSIPSILRCRLVHLFLPLFLWLLSQQLSSSLVYCGMSIR